MAGPLDMFRTLFNRIKEASRKKKEAGILKKEWEALIPHAQQLLQKAGLADGERDTKENIRQNPQLFKAFVGIVEHIDPNLSSDLLLKLYTSLSLENDKIKRSPPPQNLNWDADLLQAVKKMRVFMSSTDLCNAIGSARNLTHSLPLLANEVIQQRMSKSPAKTVAPKTESSAAPKAMIHSPDKSKTPEPDTQKASPPPGEKSKTRLE